MLAMLSAGPVLIMRRGRPAAVLVGFDEYQELMEAIQDARDREILSELRAEAESTESMSLEEFRAALAADGLLEEAGKGRS